MCCELWFSQFNKILALDFVTFVLSVNQYVEEGLDIIAVINYIWFTLS